MEPINVRELQVDSLLMFYSAEEEKWLLCQVADIGLNYLTLRGAEGSMSGWTWTEGIRNIQDPDHYRQYIPKPPKRLSRFHKLLKRLRWI